MAASRVRTHHPMYAPLRHVVPYFDTSITSHPVSKSIHALAKKKLNVYENQRYRDLDCQCVVMRPLKSSCSLALFFVCFWFRPCFQMASRRLNRPFLPESSLNFRGDLSSSCERPAFMNSPARYAAHGGAARQCIPLALLHTKSK